MVTKGDEINDYNLICLGITVWRCKPWKQEGRRRILEKDNER